jgi:hypothetical protein
MTLAGIPLPENNERRQDHEQKLDVFVKSLLADQHIGELPITEQGRVIVDRFIGGLVRQGEVTSSRDQTFSPAEILGLMDGLNGEESLKDFSRSGGLREAVRLLSEDPRSATVIGLLSTRLESEFGKDGTTEQFTLTSLAQIEGYLQAGGAKNRLASPRGGIEMDGDSWIPVLVDGIARMSKDESRTWMTRTDAYGFIESSAPLLKNTGRDWLKATSTADTVGVDMELVRRSAEKVQGRMTSSRHLAEMAFSTTMTGRIDQYNADLSRRSLKY